MNILERFLQAETNTQELYEDVMSFIISYHIRCGEFEGNEYIIKKMDRTNFILFPEYTDADGERETHGAISIYRNNLIKEINNYAQVKGIQVIEVN